MATGRLEHTPEGWDASGEGYERFIAPFFAHFARDALRLVGVRPGDRVLDVAAGPGTLALLAARQAAAVVAVDFAPGMVARLRGQARTAGLTNLAAAMMDGQALAFPDDSFDAVFSMFGLIFFPDRAAGFRELHRVLRPGGTAAVAGWHRSISTAFAQAARRAIPGLPTPTSLSLQDPDVFVREMRRAGFTQVEVQSVTHHWEVPTPEAAWEAIKDSSPVFAAYAGEQMAAIRPLFLEEQRAEFGEGAVRLEAEAHLGLGTK